MAERMSARRSDHRAHRKRREVGNGSLRGFVRRIVHRHVKRLAEAPHTTNEDGDETMALGELFGDEIEKLARKSMWWRDTQGTLSCWLKIWVTWVSVTNPCSTRIFPSLRPSLFCRVSACRVGRG